MTITFDKNDFNTPGTGRGLLDVFKYRYLLRVLISKSSSLRYRNSVLGWFWSYVRPTVQFLVYYLVMGRIVGLHGRVEDYPIYLFSGLVIVNLFNDAMGATTRSIVSNGALVRKIYLPRELFPIAAVVGSFVHFLPQMAVLMFVCVLFGWLPSLTSVGLMLAGLLLVTTFVLGVGLLLSAINVRFRDAQNFIEIIRTIATWSSPIMYTWVMVYQHTTNHRWIFDIYMSNPITVAVELFHNAFWAPLVPESSRLGWAPGFEWHVLSAVGIIIVVTFIGQFVFRRFERTFAQDL
ncbi:ABC transporter permease [Microbacterium protaetiae]|uniref:Transport permease protein n=1 Tax=Microbacterium protaetiae TaxID=2509458 RepID=A0A4V0YDG2_9MICO|nr:ABC transporter permease [Microbacterium protaetiae]QAY60601.1 ABC transporter permease [Microbacterium protaetiae]